MSSALYEPGCCSLVVVLTNCPAWAAAQEVRGLHLEEILALRAELAHLQAVRGGPPAVPGVAAGRAAGQRTAAGDQGTG